MLAGILVAVFAASGCGLKGPLYLPEKSDVTIRPAPAPAAPETAAEPAPAPEPAQKPEQPPKDAEAGPDRG
jgi:predicted small lipoprotein YifL